MTIPWGDEAGRLAYNVKAQAQTFKAAADGAASTATAETAFFQAPVDLVIEQVEFVPSAALTADNANNAVITVTRRNADGTGNVTVATVTTNVASGNWTQWVSKVLTLTAANAGLSAGMILTLTIAKGGTGVVVPAGQLICSYRRA